MTRDGEVQIDVEGQPYRLVLDINAMVALEEAVDQSFGEVMTKCQKGRLGAIRAVLWAALQKHHAEMSLADVGTWMGKAGLDVLLQSIQQMSSGTAPDPADAADLGVKKPKRPRKARAT